MTAPSLPYCSVIVPTYRRLRQLPPCLAGLASLDYPRDRYEVIVVDDGGQQVPERAIASLAEKVPVQVLHVSHRGPAAARNAGAARAKGALLAFTDDDCIPASNWLRTLAESLDHHSNDMIGGRTVNALEENIYSSASQLLIDYLYLYYGQSTGDGRFFTSSNLALPTQRFLDLGGFDASFPGAAGEDREFCDRWIHSGGAMRYVPEAMVYHAHQLSLRSFWQQHARYGRGAYRFHRLRARRASRKMRIEPPTFYANMISYPFRHARGNRRFALAGLLLLSQISNAFGYYHEAIGGRTTVS
jgi:cellulose synthase/poly-beta-1,6-N-acetylglucosamine synthase-like glycosyltransferase